MLGDRERLLELAAPTSEHDEYRAHSPAVTVSRAWRMTPTMPSDPCSLGGVAHGLVTPTTPG
jgi:hypothetical protein